MLARAVAEALEARVLLSSVIQGASNASWSPTGQRLVYDVGDNIYASNVDGSNLVQLTQMPSPRKAWGATYRPGTSQVYYLDNSPGGADFWWVARTSNDTSPGRQPLLEVPGGDSFTAPRFSPDGSQFTYGYNINIGSAAHEIFIANADGSNSHQVLRDDQITGSVTWGSGQSSSELAFFKNTGSNIELMLAGTDGSNEHSILNDTGASSENDGQLDFSPDGSQIVFANGAGLWVIGVDGNGLHQLPGTDSTDSYPRFSPDGSEVSFTISTGTSSNVGFLLLGSPSPVVPAAAITTPSGTQSGNVTINYTLTDANSDPCSILAQYSPDGGTTWDTATLGSGGDGTTGLTSSPSGTSHTFVWASATDLGSVLNSNIEFRITPSSASGTGSAATSGIFTVGVGSDVDLSPLDLRGSFTAEGNSTFTASGTIEIGFEPGNGQTFEPLLTVDGMVSYNTSDITVDGIVTADIGNLSLPVLQGSFVIPVGHADTSNLQDTGNSHTQRIAGLPIDITSLSLIPAGQGVSAPEINVYGSITLPSPLDTTISGGLLIASQGLRLESGSISFPDVSFDLWGLDIDATGLSVSYNSTSDQLILQGSVKLPHIFDVTADFSGDGNGIFIGSYGVNLAGSLSLQNLTLPGGWGLDNAELTFNTATLSYSGSAEIDIPGFFKLGGSLSVVNGELDGLSITASGLNYPVFDTGVFLTGVGGGVSNLTEGPVTFSGLLDFSFGPDETISLPAWLGGSITTDLATLDLNASISSQELTGSGTLNVAGGAVATASITNASLNFESRVFTAQGELSVVDGVFSGGTNLTIGNGDLLLSATGDASLPLSKIQSWWRDVTLANGNLLLNLQPSSLSNDYVDVWGNAFTFGPIGVHVPFDGSFPSLLNAQNLPQTDPPASETFSVASGTPWIVLGASWTNNVTAPVQIQAPDGTTYTQSDLQDNGNVDVVSQLSGPTQLAFGISDPQAGNWTVSIPNSQALGTVQFFGIGGTASPTLQVSAPTIAVAGQPILLTYNVTNANPDDTVALYYSTTPGGETGALIAESLSSSGLATYSWAPSNLPPGNYYVFGMVESSTSVPKFGYAVQNLNEIQTSSDLTVTAPALATLDENSSLSFSSDNLITVNDPNSIDNADQLTLAVANGELSLGTTSGLTFTSGSNESATMTINGTIAALNSALSGLVYTPTPGYFGSDSLNITLTDGGNADLGVSLTASTTVGLTVTPVPTQLLIIQQPSNATAGSTVNPSVVLEIEDQFGHVITSDDSFVTLSANSGPGTLSGITMIQAQYGVATFENLSLDTAGTYTLTASDTNDYLSSAPSIPFTIMPAAASQLVFTTQPADATAATTMAPVFVTIEDQYGNVETADNSAVNLAIASGPAGGVFTPASILSANAVNGVATFSVLALDTAGTYTLAASDTADSLSGFVSNSFTITPAAAAKLAFLQQPTNTTAGNLISPAVTVAVEDQYGNIVTSDNSYVILHVRGPLSKERDRDYDLDGGFPGGVDRFGDFALSAACESRHLHTYRVQVQNGVAVFSNLSLDKAGTYTLKATDDCLAAATSNSFAVTPAAATRMVFLDMPCINGRSKTFGVEVALFDKYGNLATNDTSSVTLSLGTHPKNAVLSGTLTEAVVNGVATFDGLSLSPSGCYALVAADSNGIPSVVSPHFYFGRDLHEQFRCGD